MVFGISPCSVWRFPWLSGTMCFSCIPVLSYTLHLLPSSALSYELNEKFLSYTSIFLPKFFISHKAFPASSHFTKILSVIDSTLSLMRPTFKNCSACQVPGLPFIFLEPPAISLRQALSSFYSFFSICFISIIQTPLNFFIPK